jgi:hypothetical protein
VNTRKEFGEIGEYLMNANELFEVSKSEKNNGKRLNKRGFTPRVYGVLRRAGFLLENDEKLVMYLKKFVLSGEIWGLVGLGEKGVMEICEWLEKQEQEDDKGE